MDPIDLDLTVLRFRRVDFDKCKWGWGEVFTDSGPLFRTAPMLSKIDKQASFSLRTTCSEFTWLWD